MKRSTGLDKSVSDEDRAAIEAAIKLLPDWKPTIIWTVLQMYCDRDTVVIQTGFLDTRNKVRPGGAGRMLRAAKTGDTWTVKLESKWIC